MDKELKDKTVIIIGGGIGGLAAANIFAKAGHNVTVLEKNITLGGRTNVFTEKGFTFDMGPSWYLMPDVFEHYYSLIGEDINKHLDLIKLNPSYRTFFENNKQIDISPDVSKTKELFESLEPGAGDKFESYIKQSSFQYNVAYQNFLFKNYDSVLDFFNLRVIRNGLKMNLFSNMNSYVDKFFQNSVIHKVLEYTLVFLGASPYNAPAIYALMSHVDFVQGVFYPKGGLYEIIKSLKKISENNNVILKTGEEALEIICDAGKAIGVKTIKDTYYADIIISNADIAHTELSLIKDEKLRMYSQKYWDNIVMAPSGFILYMGLNKEIPGLLHHNLYFVDDWKKNFDDIFENPKPPVNPCFYVCCPTKTDKTIAPPGKDSLFVLVPFPANVFMTEKEKEDYKEHILDLMALKMNLKSLRSDIEYLRTYDSKDFKDDYNSFQGTALGFAHTLMQSASFRPKNIHSKIKNLYFVGAGTTPGVGLPMCLISAELVYKRVYNIKGDGPLSNLNG